MHCSYPYACEVRMDASTLEAQIRAAARVVTRHRLVTAFGHISARSGPGRFLMTPPIALGALDDNTPLLEVNLEAEALPPGVAGETWIHWAIYRSRPEVGAICRGQPESVHPLAALGGPIRPIHGQGAWVSAHVPVLDDATLVRSRPAGEALAGTLAGQSALIMRGNGAVALGGSVPEAVTRLWLLDVSARMILQARAAGVPKELSDTEVAYWQRSAPELMPRLWAYLAQA
jgi:HCOMODA/2-hydroxy-3-carboxy-muconic semialdehyde decarboxylase